MKTESILFCLKSSWNPHESTPRKFGIFSDFHAFLCNFQWFFIYFSPFASCILLKDWDVFCRQHKHKQTSLYLFSNIQITFRLKCVNLQCSTWTQAKPFYIFFITIFFSSSPKFGSQIVKICYFYFAFCWRWFHESFFNAFVVHRWQHHSLPISLLTLCSNKLLLTETV